jgi:hypothetical protein
MTCPDGGLRKAEGGHGDGDDDPEDTDREHRR